MRDKIKNTISIVLHSNVDLNSTTCNLIDITIITSDITIGFEHEHLKGSFSCVGKGTLQCNGNRFDVVTAVFLVHTLALGTCYTLQDDIFNLFLKTQEIMITLDSIKILLILMIIRYFWHCLPFQFQIKRKKGGKFLIIRLIVNNNKSS